MAPPPKKSRWDKTEKVEKSDAVIVRLYLKYLPRLKQCLIRMFFPKIGFPGGENVPG